MRSSMILVLAVFAITLTGCGVGAASPEMKVSETTDDYLRALAAGDTAKACAQLAPTAKRQLAGDCGAAMKQIASHVGAGRLTDAADDGLELDVAEFSARVTVPALNNARLVLVRSGERWRIRDGFELDS
jgi:hypothetical protein